LYGDNISVTAAIYASLEMAVGKDAAPLVLAVGSLAALATLTLLAVTVRRRRAAAHAPGVEHVPLADFDDCDDDAELEASTAENGSEEPEREKLTASVFKRPFQATKSCATSKLLGRAEASVHVNV